ncbi:hypothetical protein MHYP_G00034870 [Metynnis hypsauchen]
MASSVPALHWWFPPPAKNGWSHGLEPQISTRERLKSRSPRRFRLVALLDWTRCSPALSVCVWTGQASLLHSALLSVVSAVHNAAEDKMANQPTELEDRV